MNSPVINIKDTDTINCSNCGKKIMFVYCRPMTEERKIDLEKNNMLLSKVQASCPCGDKSYDYEVEGEFRYHPADGIKITGFTQKDGKAFFKTSR